MNNREKSERYDELISNVLPAAAAIGRQEPYHLTYLRMYREILPKPVKTECGRFPEGKEKCEME